MSPRHLIFICLALSLTNCGSSPKTHFFTLSAKPPSGGQPAPISLPVTVAAVHVPPSLDRREMARGTGGNAVDVDEQDRWTAPLGDMVRRVLSEDLAERISKERIILPDAPAPRDTGQIVLSISEYGPTGGAVKLDGSWSLLSSNQKLILRRDVALQTPSPAPDANGQAAAMSELLGQLASDVTDALTRTDLRKVARSRPSSGRRSITISGRGPE